MRRTLFVLLLVVGSLVAQRAAAQPKASLSSVRYSPAVGPGNYLAVEGAEVAAHAERAYGLSFDYANDAIAIDDPCAGLRHLMSCESGRRSFIEHTGLAHFLFAIGLFGRTQLAVDLPIGGLGTNGLRYEVANTGGASPFRDLRPRDGFAFGDLRIAMKRSLWTGIDQRLRVAVSAFGTLPTALLTSDRDCQRADTCTFLGEKGMQLGASGIAEFMPVEAVRVGANLGLTYRPLRDFLGVETGTELTLAVAAAYVPIERLTVKAELASALVLAGVEDTPLEARAGVAYGRDLVVTLGAGAGIVGEVGSPRYRLIAAVQWIPKVHDEDGDRIEDDDDLCPRVKEDRDGYEDGDGCPDDDDDRDGLPDAQDDCDRAAEDRDGFEDGDGCPDPDNDRDGVPDGYDSCEGEAEDIDGDHDDDGCADHDSDRDGVPDTRDKCPSEAEDTDGLGDEDGCPELDQDGDGVPDTEDACPEKSAEKRRSPKAERGCP